MSNTHTGSPAQIGAKGEEINNSKIERKRKQELFEQRRLNKEVIRNTLFERALERSRVINLVNNNIEQIEKDLKKVDICEKKFGEPFCVEYILPTQKEIEHQEDLINYYYQQNIKLLEQLPPYTKFYQFKQMKDDSFVKNEVSMKVIRNWMRSSICIIKSLNDFDEDELADYYHDYQYIEWNKGFPKYPGVYEIYNQHWRRSFQARPAAEEFSYLRWLGYMDSHERKYVRVPKVMSHDVLEQTLHSNPIIIVKSVYLSVKIFFSQTIYPFLKSTFKMWLNFFKLAMMIRISWTVSWTIMMMGAVMGNRILTTGRNIYGWWRRAEDYDRIIQHWRLCITDPTNHHIPDSTKLAMVEIYAAIQTAFNIFNGRKTDAMGHAAYFMITRPEPFFQLLKNINWDRFQHATFNVTHIRVHWAGRDYYVTRERHDEIVNEYNRNGVMRFTAEEALPMPQQQSWAVISNTIGELFTKIRGRPMTDAELRHANYEYTYIKNVNHDREQKLETLKFVISWIMRHTYGIDPFDQDFINFSGRIADAMMYMDKTIKLKSSEINQAPVSEDVIVHYNEFLELKHHPMMGSLALFILNDFNSRFEKFEKKALGCIAENEDAYGRVKPVGLLITGPSGVGKTRFVEFYESCIVRFDYLENIAPDPIYRQDMTYNYTAKDRFHSGYHGQKFMRGDDRWQSKDLQDRRDEALEMIHMLNSSRYLLNMPGIDDKGKEAFRSQYVTITTNLFEGENQSTLDPTLEQSWEVGLTHPAAIIRRFDLIIRRTDPATDLVKDMTFFVQQCELLPHLKGVTLTALEVVKTSRRLKQIIKERHQRNQYTADNLDNMFHEAYFPGVPNPNVGPKQIDVTDLIQDADDNTVQVLQTNPKTIDKPSIVQETSESVMGKFLKLKTYEWWDSPNRNIYIGACIVLTSAALVPLLYYAFTKTPSPGEGEVHPQSHSRKEHTGSTRKMKVVSKPKVQAMQSDETYLPCLAKTLSRSCVYLEGVASFEDHYLVDHCVAIHIKDGFFCAPLHFMAKFNDFHTKGQNVNFTMKFDSNKYSFTPPKCVKIEQTDMVVFQMEIKMNLPPSAYKHAIPENELKEIPMGTPMNFVSVNKDGAVTIRSVTRALNTNIRDYKIGEDLIVTKQCYTYWEKTSNGDSGAMLCIEDPQNRVRWIGMHVLQQSQIMNTVGVSVPITKEFFDEILKDCIDLQSAPFPLEILEEVSPAKASKMARHSTYCPTPLHGIYGPPKYVPSRMRPGTNKEGVEVDPYILALGKLHQTEVHPVIIPKDCEDWLFYLYPPEENHVLTYHEALNGMVGKNYPSISANTSSGHPYNTAPNASGKSPYIIWDGEKYIFQDKFFALLEAMHQKLQKGEQIPAYWADALKAELVSIEKWESFKTRLFSLCPLHLLIFFRMYTGDLVAAVQKKCATHPIKVGLNVHSLDWTLVHEYLAQYDGSCVAADYKNFDGSIPAYVLKFVCDWINKWYDDGPVNAKIRELLFEHIYNAIRIGGTRVYKLARGNPSGNPITSLINSLINLVYLYMVITRGLKIPIEKVRLIVYGDDCIITFEEVGIRYSDLAPFIKEWFDVEYTDFTKKISDKHHKLSDVPFLGRRFVKEGQLYRAPLDMDVIQSMPYYFKKKSGKRLAMVSTIQSMFIEFSHYGSEIFNKESNFLLEQIKERWPEIYDECLDNRKYYYHFWDAMYGPKPTIKQYLQSNPIRMKQTSSYYGDDAELVDWRSRQLAEKLIRKFSHKDKHHSKHQKKVVKKFKEMAANVKDDVEGTPHYQNAVFEYNVSLEVNMTNAIKECAEKNGIKLQSNPRMIATAPPLMAEVLRFIKDYEGKISRGTLVSHDHHCRYMVLKNAMEFCNHLGIDPESNLVEPTIATIREDTTRFIPTEEVKMKFKKWTNRVLFIIITLFCCFLCWRYTHQVLQSEPIRVSNINNTSNEMDNSTSSNQRENTDRAIHEVTPTQQHQLGSFQDVAPIETTDVNPQIKQGPYNGFNMEVFDLDSVTSRTYPLQHITWTTAQAVGTNLYSANILQVMLAIPFIADKVKNFKYGRFGFEFIIRTSANRNLYGSVAMSYVNKCGTHRYGTFSDIFVQSGFPMVTLPASSSQVGVLRIPFIFDARVLDLINYQASDMGQVYLHVLNILRDINGTVSTSIVSIFGRLLEPELFFPITLQSSARKVPKVHKEANQKSQQGSISSALEKVDTLASAVGQIPIVGQYADMVSLAAKGGKMVAGMFGLDKPTTLATTNVGKIDPFVDFNYGKGMDLSTKVGFTGENAISTIPNVGGRDMDEMDLLTLVGTPQMTKQLVVTNNLTTVYTISQLHTDEVCYVDQVSRMFQYHSGTYKFLIQVNASYFHTLRLVFFLNDTAAVGATHWENCYYQVPEVQGWTEIKLAVTFPSNYVMDLNTTGTGPALLMMVDAWSQPDNAISTPIDINVWKAGGSDWRVGTYIESAIQLQSNPREIFREDFPYLHSSMTTFAQEGLVVGENLSNIRDIIKKVHYYLAVAPNANVRSYQESISTGGHVYAIGFEAWAQFYGFWRGSIRVKAIKTDTTTVNCMYFKTFNSIVYGTGISAPTNPIIAAEIPYFYPQLYKSTRDTVVAPDLMYTQFSGAANKFLCKAAGDDFSFHFISPLPSGAFVTSVPTGYGILALQTFLAG